LNKPTNTYLLLISLFFVLLFTGCFKPSASLTFIKKAAIPEVSDSRVPSEPADIELDDLTEKSLLRYGPLIRHYSDRYQMDWRLVLAVIRQESGFQHDAVSHKGAYGLMQIMPVTQVELTDKIGVEEATSPRNNIRAGVFHLRSLYRYFDEAAGEDRVQLTLAAYNAGLGRIRDAQAIAKYLGLNPNTWRDVRDALPLLSRRYSTLHRQIWPEGKPRSGYFGNYRQTVNYVENIMQYYRDYKLALN
jgi:membrane-bound lytic murein transglycosylase F